MHWLWGETAPSYLCGIPPEMAQARTVGPLVEDVHLTEGGISGGCVVAATALSSIRVARGPEIPGRPFQNR